MPKTGHPPNTGHFHFLIFNHSSYNFINTKITYLDRIFFEDINLKHDSFILQRKFLGVRRTH